jgi:SNF2 family DNA or RNA helicase
MSVKEKQESMDRFQKDNDCRVMIANRKAGGIGVNLTAASYSIVYSRNFSLSDELQSEARNFRSGSEIHEKITKIDLAAKDTIDIRVLESLSNKEFTSEQIIGWFK